MSRLPGFVVCAIVVASFGCSGGGGGGGGSDPTPTPTATPNTAPIAVAAEPGVRVKLGGVVPLDATGSSDPDGDPITYQWTLAQKPEGSIAAIASPTASTTSFVADLPGVYLVTLAVSDGEDVSALDTFALEALPRIAMAPGVAGSDYYVESTAAEGIELLGAGSVVLTSANVGDFNAVVLGGSLPAAELNDLFDIADAGGVPILGDVFLGAAFVSEGRFGLSQTTGSDCDLLTFVLDDEPVHPSFETYMPGDQRTLDTQSSSSSIPRSAFLFGGGAPADLRVVADAFSGCLAGSANGAGYAEFHTATGTPVWLNLFQINYSKVLEPAVVLHLTEIRAIADAS